VKFLLPYLEKYTTGPNPKPSLYSPHPYTLFVNDEAGRIQKKVACLKVLSQHTPERAEEKHKEPL
jgi:hypothetical protein